MSSAGWSGLLIVSVTAPFHVQYFIILPIYSNPLFQPLACLLHRTKRILLAFYAVHTTLHQKSLDTSPTNTSPVANFTTSFNQITSSLSGPTPAVNRPHDVHSAAACCNGLASAPGRRFSSEESLAPPPSASEGSCRAHSPDCFRSVFLTARAVQRRLPTNAAQPVIRRAFYPPARHERPRAKFRRFCTCRREHMSPTMNADVIFGACYCSSRTKRWHFMCGIR